eukprot:GABV01002633.1.p4 GENE.GABV01002633.1~~GABV01002633.1.p4  ORF type:complete len:115 (-),score=27.30 GABV01002633.1:27-371(-)
MATGRVLVPQPIVKLDTIQQVPKTATTRQIHTQFSTNILGPNSVSRPIPNFFPRLRCHASPSTSRIQFANNKTSCVNSSTKYRTLSSSGGPPSNGTPAFISPNSPTHPEIDATN